MTETPDTTTATPPAAPAKPYWLYRFAAWVGIVAGIVFITSSIFFAGVWASGGGFRGGEGHHCHHHHGHHGPGAMFHKGHRGPGPMDEMGPGPMMPGPDELPASPPAPPAPPARPGR